MDELKGLGTDKWYRAVTFLSAALVVGAAAVSGDPALRKALVLLGIGGVLVGIGQWIDHPFRTRLVPHGKVSGYPYQPSLIGWLVTLLGVAVCGRAAWLLW